MSGDMFDNPDAVAVPEIHDLKIQIIRCRTAPMIRFWLVGAESAYAQGYWGCCMAPLDQAAAD